MQPNTISLDVDTLNDGTTVVTEVLTRDDFFGTRSVYISSNHNVNGPRETLTFYRTYPKVNGNFPGTSKVAMKFSYDHAVDGVDGVSTLSLPLIMEVSASVPVGVTAAQSLVMRQRALALLDHDTVQNALFASLSI